MHNREGDGHGHKEEERAQSGAKSGKTHLVPPPSRARADDAVREHDAHLRGVHRHGVEAAPRVRLVREVAHVRAQRQHGVAHLLARGLALDLPNKCPRIRALGNVANGLGGVVEGALGEAKGEEYYVGLQSVDVKEVVPEGGLGAPIESAGRVCLVELIREMEHREREALPAVRVQKRPDRLGAGLAAAGENDQSIIGERCEGWVDGGGVRRVGEQHPLHPIALNCILLLRRVRKPDDADRGGTLDCIEIS
jgi:hypothetical protein